MKKERKVIIISNPPFINKAPIYARELNKQINFGVNYNSNNKKLSITTETINFKFKLAEKVSVYNKFKHKSKFHK